MFKYITKKIVRSGSFSTSGGGASEGTPTAEKKTFVPTMEFDDDGVRRFSELLEVMLRIKFDDMNGEPLVQVTNDTVTTLMSNFITKKYSKKDLEQSTVSVLWSTAMKILDNGSEVLSMDTCQTLRNAGSADIIQVASRLPLPVQKLLGIIFGSSEMLIRSEPASAALVVKMLAHSVIWSLSSDFSEALRVLSKLLVEHKSLFPSCHTFARKFQRNFAPITREEWSAHATTSLAVYGKSDRGPASSAGRALVPTDIQAIPSSTSGAGAGASSDTASTGDRGNSEGPSTEAASSVVPPLKPAGVDPLQQKQHHQHQGQGQGQGEDGELGRTGLGRKPYRSSYQAELPFNDVTASASVDGTYCNAKSAFEHRLCVSFLTLYRLCVLENVRFYSTFRE
jgi:hypothetical protein